MTSRKRQAHPLASTRQSKQPRLALNGYSGSSSCPSETEGIGARWSSFAKEFWTLAGDTLHVIPTMLMPKVSEPDELDESVNEEPSPILASSSSSAFSTPRQSSQHGQLTSSPISRPISLSPSDNSLPERITPRLPSNGKAALLPEHIPLPPSPTKYTHAQSPSFSSAVPISFHTDLPSQSTPKPSLASFTSPTPTITPPRIPTLHAQHPSTDNVLQHSVVTPMSQLHLGNGPSLPSSSQPSSIFAGSQVSFGSQSSRQSSQSLKRDPLRRNPRKREHIYSKVHKANVTRQKMELREEMTRQIFAIKRKQGYQSTLTDLKGLLDYQRKLEGINLENVPPPIRASALGDKLLSQRRRRSFETDDDTQFLQRALDNAKATMNSPKPPKPFHPSLEQLEISHRAKDADIERRLRPPVQPLPTALPPADEQKVKEILQKRGVVSKFAKEQVSSADLARLRPGEWLNDEIINFYGAMLLGRSESGKENPAPAAAKGKQVAGKGKTPLNIHYFSSFFWTKLAVEGYEKGRLAKWTKKIDIFSKDIILMPVNHGNAHWTAAAINFRAKRFESYDSMGMAKAHVWRKLREYVKLEHQNKRKKEFDFTGWEDWAPDSTPQQENGYDCGVFTCQFMEALSRGEESFNFSQKDMPYLRRRMIWEIGNAKLRDDR